MTALDGAALGLLTGVGLITAVRWSPPMRRPRLDDRLTPYIRDALPSLRVAAVWTPRTPFPTLEVLLAPTMRAVARRVDQLLGRSQQLRRRLEQAGSPMTVEDFRVEQLLCAATGLLLGLAVAAVAAIAGSRTSATAFLILGLVLMVAGIVVRDQLLSSQVARRERRMLAEFPTIAEMLALAVAAGEGAVGALERVTRLASGQLSAELQRTLAEARTGSSLVDALDAMAARTTVPAIARFVDGVAVAVERGTPLADVLRAQAADVRDQGRRELLEAGGRKEIAMLVPVVFLLLPVTIVFALFPGLVTLNLAVP